MAKPGDCCIVSKALYGGATSARAWWKKLADTLRSMGIKNSRADLDVWIRLSQDGKFYEYIGTHTDDLMVFSKYHKSIIEEVASNFKL